MKPLEIRFGREEEFPHLPPGHRPGPQSVRNRTRRSFLFPFVALVGTAMLVAGLWVAAGGRGDEFDRQEELWGGLFFAACGFMCAYVGWSNSRRRRYPRLRGATVTPAPATARRGETVDATVGVPQARGSRFELGLVCDERYDIQVRVARQGGATVVRQTNDTTVHEDWRAVPAGATTFSATFALPRDAPYSYEGDCVSYGWRLTLRSVRRARRDARFDQPIWVAP